MTLIFIAAAAVLCAQTHFVQASEPVSLTLMHTNDLHSHFRAENSALGLGGLARLKTAIDRVRRENPKSLLIDGGDWSEGNIYYNLGAGRETIKMMDHVGYDVAVVGNHDWYNGPDVLLRAIAEADAKMTIIAANVSTKNYPKRADFERLIPPYVIKEVGGLQIAFIGLLTYEFIYDSYFRPIKIEPPFNVAKELAHQLKSCKKPERCADLVIGVSHNSVARNLQLLEIAPDLDGIVSGHQHTKLTQPRMAKRAGRPDGWVIEAGAHGRFLGRMDLKVTPRSGEPGSRARIESFKYKLIQIDSTIPDDQPTLKRVVALENELERIYGPIFHELVGESHVYVGRNATETRMGNLATDAYRDFTRADIGVDQTNLIYGELHEGQKIRTVDVYNVNPGIHNPLTNKSWTVQVLPVKGLNLQALLNVLFASKAVAQRGIVSVSGLEMIYDPMIKTRSRNRPAVLDPGSVQIDMLDALQGYLADDESCTVCKIIIDGQPIQRDKVYTLAAGGGVIEALRFLNGLIPGAFPLDNLKDTGVEDWVAMKDYIRAISPLTKDNVPLEGRVRSAQSDLGISLDDIESRVIRRTSDHVIAKIRVTITNYGVAPSVGSSRIVRLRTNSNGTNLTRDAAWTELGEARSIPALESGKSVTLEWESAIPVFGQLYNASAKMEGLDAEVNHSNDDSNRYFSLSARR